MALAAVGCPTVDTAASSDSGSASPTISSVSSSVATGGASSVSSGGAAGASSTTSATGGVGGARCPAPIVPSYCGTLVYACGDGIDNDGDGLIDAGDPDCLGACDNTEESYATGIPYQCGGSCECMADCYFDYDKGSGNDDCHWSYECDPLEVAPTFDPVSFCSYDPTSSPPGADKTCAELATSQSSACTTLCRPLTPNGCDCFGCCELPAGSANFVYLGSAERGVGTCSAQTVDDPGKCHPCTPVPSCINPCDPCEACIGKPDPDPGCPAVSCPAGIEPCNAACGNSCPRGTYCITGCCQPLLR
jgi:hypothetical protein